MAVRGRDVCSIFASAIGCPNVGWNFFLDTTLFSDGTHTLAVTGTTTAGGELNVHDKLYGGK